MSGSGSSEAKYYENNKGEILGDEMDQSMLSGPASAWFGSNNPEPPKDVNWGRRNEDSWNNQKNDQERMNYSYPGRDEANSTSMSQQRRERDENQKSYEKNKEKRDNWNSKNDKKDYESFKNDWNRGSSNN